MEIVSTREFARRIGVSLTAIQKGIKSGRVKAVTDPETGKVKGLDWDTQASAWDDNCKHIQKRPQNQAGGRPRLDGQPVAPSSTRRSIENRQASAPPPDSPGEEKPGMSLADIQRARELVKLQIDNEKLKEVRGETAPVAQMRSDGAKLAATVISGLYNIPDRASDDLAGMSDPNEIHKYLLREIDVAVNELRKAYGQP